MSEPPSTPRPVTDPWRTLLALGAPRLTKAQLLATLMTLFLGFAIAVQARQTSLAGLENLREEELVRILDNVDQEQSRLSQEVRTLEVTRERLVSGATTQREAEAQARQRLDALGVLTGTVAARGPGITMTIEDPQKKVTSTVLLDAVQELRDAGAEAIQIGDVRVVASSAFTDVDGTVRLSGATLSRPFTFRVIGDGQTLAAAMEIPGGVGNTVRGLDGSVQVAIKTDVEVTALQSVATPQYARPVPTPGASP